MLTRKTRLFGSLAVLAIAGGLGGCSTVDGDLSPEMLSLYQRPNDYYNARALTIDTNNRQIWNDWQRITLFDRPTRLAPTPSTH